VSVSIDAATLECTSVTKTGRRRRYANTSLSIARAVKITTKFTDKQTRPYTGAWMQNADAAAVDADVLNPQAVPVV